ncbi:MAG: Ig-like domain-containing protein, partial [Planctomycetaceae bacterium]
MMRISLDSPALIAVRSWLAGVAGQQSERVGRGRPRQAARQTYLGERLEPRTMLDAGMQALLPDLVEASDTGFSSTDNLTSDRTPALTGSAAGAASEVRLIIDGKRVATVPVVNGAWNYTVPAEAALPAGKHTIAVRPVDASGKAGIRSTPLDVTLVTVSPATPTINLGPLSDTGVTGDGKTTYATPTFRGIVQPGRYVNISIDGVQAGRVKSDAKTGAWLFKAPHLANGVHDVTAVTENFAGLQSSATSFQVTVNGLRTVMLDASGGQSVELKASHLLGQGSQGFIVTQVHRGTLQKWVAARNDWVTIPARALTSLDPASLQKASALRTILFTDTVRWTPARGDAGTAPAFAVMAIDRLGGLVAPTPESGTVPGKLVNAQVAPLAGGVGQTITWE